VRSAVLSDCGTYRYVLTRRMPLGSAVLTTAGRLPYRGIIHVAGINLRWRATEASIRDSTRNAVTLAGQQGYQSIALPIIGTGSGGFPEDRAQDIMRGSVAAATLPFVLSATTTETEGAAQ